MLISVIIPVYNVELYLAECLDSVLAQTYPHYEVICVNDGSTDGSQVLLDNYVAKYDKIQVINQKNKGLSAARNAGIATAKGDYIFLLDSDDKIEKHAFETLVAKSNGEDFICFNGKRYFEETNTEDIPDEGISAKFESGWDYYNQFALIDRKFHFVCTVLRLYRREFLLQHKLHFQEGIFHEDNLFTPIACYYAQKVKIIPDCLYIYRIRKGSITQNVKAKRLLDIVYIANTLAEFFISKDDIDKKTIYREIAGSYFRGFMPEEIKAYGNNDSILRSKINWHFYQKISIFPRHKRIYRLLKVHPALFRCYLLTEKWLKIVR